MEKATLIIHIKSRTLFKYLSKVVMAKYLAILGKKTNFLAEWNMLKRTFSNMCNDLRGLMWMIDGSMKSAIAEGRVIIIDEETKVGGDIRFDLQGTPEEIDEWTNQDKARVKAAMPAIKKWIEVEVIR